jgi:outer membrane receptor protein involved in Fe transport
VDIPSGTLVCKAAPGWQVHLGGGMGYKQPDYDQLYRPYTDFANLPAYFQNQYHRFPGSSSGPGYALGAFGYGETGNPGLRPERNMSAEIGTEITVGILEAGFSGFANYYNDLISAVPVYTGGVTWIWTYANLDHALFAGTEDSLRVRLADWLSPYATFTFVSAKDGNGNDIPGRLRLKFGFGVEIKPEKQWSLDLDGRYVDRYPLPPAELNDFGMPPTAVPYWNLDIKAKYAISDHLSGFATVGNLFNEQIATYQAIPQMRRNFGGGLEAEL